MAAAARGELQRVTNWFRMSARVRRLAVRAQQGDPTLVILTESIDLNKEVLALAQTRLGNVLQAVGLVSGTARTASVGPGGDVGLTATLQAQESAAAALLRRSQEATRSMLDQAEAVRRREQSIAAGSSAGGVPEPSPQTGGKG